MLKYAIFIWIILLIKLTGQAQHVNSGMVLTFDDMYLDNWHKLLPIFEKYNARGTFFFTDIPNDRMDSSHYRKIKELYEAGNEIASHSVNHYSVPYYLDTASVEDFLKREIQPSISWFDSVLHIPISSFAYPKGIRNNESDKALKDCFRILRGTNYDLESDKNRISRLTYSGLTFGVGIDKNYGYSLAEIFLSLLQCKRKNEIQVFYAHNVVETVTDDYQVSYAMLDSLLNFAVKNGLGIYTLSETLVPEPGQPRGVKDIRRGKHRVEYYYEILELPGINSAWTIRPEEAGEIVAIYPSQVRVSWNEAYSGVAKISAAYTNLCGQGDFSKPLKVRVLAK